MGQPELFLIVGIFSMICGCLFDMHCQGLFKKVEVIEEVEEEIIIPEHPPVRVYLVIPSHVKGWSKEELAEWRDNVRRCDELHQMSWARSKVV